MSSRIKLTDRRVARLPQPARGSYLVRDAELRSFFLVVGRYTKTYTVQADIRVGGQRKSVRVAVGRADEVQAREARQAAREALREISRGSHPKPEKRPALPAAAPEQTTLRTAWSRYRDAHMIRKGRSPRTIESYTDHIERLLQDWLDRPLADFADDPRLLVRRHDKLTASSGPYMANLTLRTFRAIYNHARKSDRSLPAENPAQAVDWNNEQRRDTAMGLADLPVWFEQVAALSNPVRREYHLMMLLSGSRPSALKQARLEHVDLRRRVLHIPCPKGGKRKAFDVPLSREMIRAIVRVRRAGRIMHPDTAQTWLFPADPKSGHLSEHGELRTVLAKYGNDLRQSYRTLAQAAGVSETDAMLLMNHSLPGVNAGYITRQKLMQDHLRRQQEAISRIIMEPARSTDAQSATSKWLGKARSGAGR